MGCGSGTLAVDGSGRQELSLALPDMPLEGGTTQVVAPDGQILEFFVPAGYPPNTVVKVWHHPLPKRPPEPKKPDPKKQKQPAKAAKGKQALAQAEAKAGAATTGLVAPDAAGGPGAAEPGDAQASREPQQVDAKVVHPEQKGMVQLPAQLPRMDGSWDWLRKENDQLHRATRVDASAALREAFKKGGYFIADSGKGKGAGTFVKFSHISKMVAGTRMLSLSRGLPKLPKEPGYGMVLEYGQGITPMEKAGTMAQSGFRPAAVSAASAYQAGGGFASGGRHALEEAFCSQSTLYPSLEKAKELWAAGVQKGWWKGSSQKHSQHIPVDGCILSPQVEIFRGNTDQGYFAHNRTTPIAAVVSIAMFNKNSRVRDAPVDAPEKESEYEDGVRSKLTAMVHAAALSGADAIIIPDVGCGVFQNDPNVCGRICGEVLFNYGARFKRAVFTGSSQFFAAAQDAIVKASKGGIKPITADIDQRGSLMPVDAKTHQYAGRCCVCNRGLADTGFSELAILIDKSGKSTNMQFLRASCAQAARTKFPQHQIMKLPDITRNAQSFFRALDLNGNGFIEKEELRCVCALLWEGDLEKDPEAFEKDFEARFEAWDADQTGHVNKREVVTKALQPQAPKSGAAPKKAQGSKVDEDSEAVLRPPTKRKSNGLCVETMHEQSCIVWFQEQAKKRNSKVGGVSGR
jgi:uncharacterized protein (TIGR02452 family)